MLYCIFNGSYSCMMPKGPLRMESIFLNPLKKQIVVPTYKHKQIFE